ncbi:unnamed protein product [Schistosoma mattheei]|uniref:Uncharacterized protein n=1 Tax=Schistosoma mattheei TaxID=31246 RepID=A0A183PP93_9TREM|nr:unnamed protein product [Schistosoma mattheei]
MFQCPLPEAPYYPIQDNEKPRLLYTSANFLGIPTNRGQPKIGTYQGPELIRKSNFFQLVAEDGIQLIDCGDVTPVELSETEDPQRFGMKWSRSFSLTTLKIAERVEGLMKQSTKHNTESNESKSTPLVIVGGDHSMATGTILGHAKAKPDLCVLWIDAHGDINTPLNSASGNIHGMPLSFLVKELQDQIPWLDDFEGIKPWNYILRPCLLIHEGEVKIICNKQIKSICSLIETFFKEDKYTFK